MLYNLISVVLLLLFSTCDAVHWYFQVGQQRCVQKDVGGGITVSGIYRIDVYDSHAGTYLWQPHSYGIQVSVYDGHGKEILSRTYGTSGEKFQFYAEKEDRHTICLRPNITSVHYSAAPYRMYLRFEPASYDYMTGERIEEVKKGLARYFKHLINTTRTIQSDQSEARMREERFRFTSESTNSRIAIWMLVQLVLGVIVFWFQASHLKAFIVKKKLV